MQRPYGLVEPKNRMWLYDNDDDNYNDNGVIPNNLLRGLMIMFEDP